MIAAKSGLGLVKRIEELMAVVALGNLEIYNSAYSIKDRQIMDRCPWR